MRGLAFDTTTYCLYLGLNISFGSGRERDVFVENGWVDGWRTCRM